MVREHPATQQANCESGSVGTSVEQDATESPGTAARARVDQDATQTATSEDRAAVREHRDLRRHGRQARVLFLERVASLCVEAVGSSSRISF